MPVLKDETCAVCHGVIKETVHIAFVETIPVPLCESDYLLGTGVAEHLTDEEIHLLLIKRANPWFRGSATDSLNEYLAAHGN